MNRKRIAVIAGTIIGTLSLATAAGAANFGLLRSASDDPVPAVGNLDAGTVADSSSTSATSVTVASTASPSSSVGSVPVTVDGSVPGSTVTSVDDHGGNRSGGADDGATSSVPVTAPSSRSTIGGTFSAPPITTDDGSGHDGSDDDHSGSNSGSGSSNSGSGSGSSGSGHGGGDDD